MNKPNKPIKPIKITKTTNLINPTPIKKGIKSGFYMPINPDKWIITESFDTSVPRIKYRSSWELKFMRFCDFNDAILKVNSEGIVIPYVSPIDNRVHRYYMDFIVETVKGVFLVEIKPYNETIPPKKTKPRKNAKKPKSRYTYEKKLETYLINEAKWKEAKKYATKRGWKFIILTEKELDV